MSSMQRAIEKQPVESEDKAVNSVAGRVASDKVDCIVKVAPRPIDLEARLLRKNSVPMLAGIDQPSITQVSSKFYPSTSARLQR